MQSSSITPQFFKSKYQRVEYIMRNGSNYAFIDTWRIPNRSKKLNIQMWIRYDSSWYRHCFMANWWDTSVYSNAWCVSLEVNSWSVSNNRVRVYTEPNSSTGAIEFYSSNSISTWSFHSISLTINWTSWSLIVDSTTTNWNVASANTLNLSELLFIDRAKRWSEFARNHYISYFFAYENDTAVRQMYPCYRKSDNAIWMVDLVNKVFYPNAWSWSFTKWNNVPR